MSAAAAVAAADAVPKPMLGDLGCPLFEIRCRYELDMRKTTAMDSLLLYLRGNDGRVHNLFDEMPDDVRSLFEDVRRLNRDGLYVPPRVGSPAPGVVDYVGKGDWFAAYLRESEAPIPVPRGPAVYAQVQGMVQAGTAGARLEVLQEPLVQGKPLVDLRATAFLGIPVASKKKEVTLRLLNDLANREMRDLLNYGVEGTHWRAVGQDGYEELGAYGMGGASSAIAMSGDDGTEWIVSTDIISIWSDRPFELVAPLSASPAFLRVPSWLPAAYREQYLREVRREDGAEPDLLAGFTFDQRLVWEQVYDYRATYHVEYLRLAAGEVPFEPTWSLLRSEAYDAVQAIQRELQRQIDAYLSRAPGSR